MAASPEDGLQAFLNAVTNHRLLSAAEERDLARRYRLGDEAARQKLITHNMRLVVSIARYYTNRGMPFGDVIQEGALGLDRAVRKYDPDRGFRFTTYAMWWIRQSIQRGLAGSGSTIRLPAQVAKIRAKARAALLQDPEQDMDLLAKSLDCDRATLERALDAAEVVTSLDREQSAGDEHTKLDAMPDPNAPDPGADPLPFDSEPLFAALDILTPLQRQVIEMRFGFGGAAPLSLEEVAAKLGCVKNTAQSAQREAMQKLRGELLSD